MMSDELTDNDQDELLALMQAARNQLEYFRDIGVTHLGGDITPAQMVESSTLADGVEDMAKKKSAHNAPEQASLFESDNVAAPPAPRASPKKLEKLEDISSEVGHCCHLCDKVTHVVFGEGNANADLMFIGEAPGADEDATGRPFVGAAGRLLDKIIEAIGMKRADVYITNVVKCRPPGNRKPTTDEIESCEPFLFREINVIKPKVIVTLGATPLFSLLRIKEGITKARGHFYDYDGTPVMATFHPAYLLRVPEAKREVWEDMKKVVAKLKELKK
jgi:DNA polymerase